MLPKQCCKISEQSYKANNNVAKYKCKVVKCEARNEDRARLKKFPRSYGGGVLPLSIINNNDGTLNDVSSTKQTLHE
jgi:hypothetical protein